MNRSEHPSPKKLAAYIQGELDDINHGEVERHLAGCDSCCDLLRRLTLGDWAEGLIETPEISEGGKTTASAVRRREPSDLQTSFEALGTVIGNYKLVQQLGEGGFGTVYLAQQQAPVKRRVALKIIKPGLDSREVIARFEAERQALAMMEHPNIASVLDAGTTESGRPFFVMELVKGIAITTFCDNERLSLPERLKLVIQICDAVQHAHQKGIIHRDIKPSNLLVSQDGGKLVPKVIDFGVAKATNQRLTDKTMHTRFGEVIGTLQYMSPEQAGANALDIDTRSDIYSLGVVLYEVLTGTTPFEGERFRSSALDGVMRMIREEEPVRPSQRLATSKELATIATHRRIQPATLARRIRGELDWIVMRAIEKQRSRRYETATALGRDIDRHLRNEPVEAGPPSVTYRLRKLARKNWQAIAVSCTFAVLLLAATALSTWQAIHTARLNVDLEQANTLLRQSTESERKSRTRARENLTTAKLAVQDFLIKVTSNERLKLADFTSLRSELLETSIPFLEKFLRQEPGDADVETWRAWALRNLARVYQQTGKTEKARQAFEQSIAVLNQLTTKTETGSEFGAAQKENADHHFNLAQNHIDLASLLRGMGELEKAMEQYEHGTSIVRFLHDEHPQTFSYRDILSIGYYNIASLMTKTGRVEEAFAAHKESLKIRKQLVADFPHASACVSALASSHRSLAIEYESLNQLQLARTHYEQVLELTDVLVSNHPNDPGYQRDLAFALHSWGIYLQKKVGDLNAALDAFKKAGSIKKRLASNFPSMPDYQLELANTEKGLGSVQSELHDVTGARQSYEAAVVTMQRLDDRFPDVPRYRHNFAQALHNLSLLLDEERLSSNEARTRLEDAQEIRRKLISAAPSVPFYRYDFVKGQNLLGNILWRQATKAEALAAFESATKYGEALVDQHPANDDYKEALSNAYCNLGNLLREIGELSQAKEFGHKAMNTVKSIEYAGGPVSKRAFVVHAMEINGKILTDCGEYKKARAAILEAISLGDELRSEYPKLNRFPDQLASLHELMAIVDIRTNRQDVALQHLKQAKEFRLQLVERQPSSSRFQEMMAQNHWSTGRHLESLEKRTQAIDEYKNAIEIYSRLAAKQGNREARRQLAICYNQLGIVFSNLGQMEKSRDHYEKALPIRQQLVDEKPENQSAIVELAGSLCNLGNADRRFGKSAQSLEKYAKAVELLTFATKRDPSDETARQYLLTTFSGQADAYARTEQFAKAAATFQLVAQLLPKNQRVDFQLSAALNFARAGHVDEATTISDELLKSYGSHPGAVYNIACVYARCAETVASDEKQEEIETNAVLLLSKCHDMNLFRKAAMVIHLMADQDLKSIRERDDFRELMKKVNQRS